MPALVRNLKNLLYLDKEIAADYDGLQADALNNFQTKANVLSVYYAEGTELSAERIALAIAAGRQSVDRVDYAIFDAGVLEEYGIATHRSKGGTADLRVNGQHVDLVNLTARQVDSLARAIQERGKLNRLTRSTVREKLVEEITSGVLVKDRVSPSILKELGV